MMGRKSSIGLDVGETAVRAVQVETGPDGPRVTTLVQKRIPPHVRDTDERWTFLKGALEELFSQEGFESREVFCCAPKSSTTVSFLSVPRMSHKDLRGAVEMELGKSIPFGLDEAVYDYTTLESIGQKERLGVIASVVEKQKLQEFVEVIEGVGLQVAGMTIPSCALESLIRHCGAFGETENVAVLDAGYGSAGLSLFKGGKLQFTRNISACGREIVKALARRLVVGGETVELSAEDVEKIIKEYDIINPSETVVEGKIPVSQLCTMARPVVDRLLSETERSLVYYRQVFKEQKIDRFVLTGGLSRLKGLRELLAERLKIKIENLNPAGSVSTVDSLLAGNFENGFSDMGVALGLSLDTGRGLDLLTDELRARNTINRVRPSVNLGIYVSLGAFLVLFGFFFMMTRITEQRHADLRDELDALESPIQKLDRLEMLNSELGQKRKQVVELAGRNPLWEGILKELGHAVPNGMVLTEVSESSKSSRGRKTLLVSGLIFSDRKNKVLSEFMSLLHTSPFFGEVFTWQIEPARQGAKASFLLECGLVY